jgi:nicotinate-nucleotide--dimethylbenzimidazole phosphoribosyltransferase
MTDDPRPAASLAEIRALLAALPTASATARAAADAREATLTKPAGALGRLEELAAWMATWQDRHPPSLRRPRVAVFAGNHGVAARGVSAYPPEVTAEMVRNFVAGGGAVNQICRSVDADLRVYELALEVPTADFTTGPAMAEDDCARAMAYGMMAVEQGIDLIALGEMGIGNTTAAAALCLALFGGTADDWTGPGTGVAGARRAAKRDIVAAGAALHAGAGDGLETLRRRGAARDRSGTARPLPGRASLRRTGACAALRGAGQATAARPRHAARRSVGRRAGDRRRARRGRLPRRDGDLRRGASQRSRLIPARLPGHSPLASSVPRSRARRNAQTKTA